jgi:hypothetical protein
MYLRGKENVGKIEPGNYFKIQDLGECTMENKMDSCGRWGRGERETEGVRVWKDTSHKP